LVADSNIAFQKYLKNYRMPIGDIFPPP
jgi:hypothetical protein